VAGPPIHSRPCANEWGPGPPETNASVTGLGISFSGDANTQYVELPTVRLSLL